MQLKFKLSLTFVCNSHYKCEFHAKTLHVDQHAIVKALNFSLNNAIDTTYG